MQKPFSSWLPIWLGSAREWHRNVHPESRLVQHRASGESKLSRASKRFGMTREASADVPGRFKKEMELEGESDKTWNSLTQIPQNSYGTAVVVPPRQRPGYFGCSPSSTKHKG